MNPSMYGKGAIKTPKEIRNRHFRLGATVSTIDWSQPFEIEKGFTLNQRNQKSSSSCTAQSTMYYCEVLDPLHQQGSARYNYSQSFLPGGGAYIWKAMSIPQTGVATPASVPDGDSSESTMEDSTLNKNAIIESRAEVYAMIPRSNIDQMAQIVRDHKGFVTGFNGHDGMFASDGTVTDWSHSDWGHAVLVVGYEMRNGVKCLKFKNSWSSNWGSNGYGFFPEVFINSGMMFDCYVYADVQDVIKPMNQDEVKKLYVLAFYREPDAGELTFWTGKPLSEFLTTAIKDRSVFLQQHE